MPFQKGDSPFGSWGKEADTKRGRGRGETYPEGRGGQCDKTWLSLAVRNYLHANATAGKKMRMKD